MLLLMMAAMCAAASLLTAAKHRSIQATILIPTNAPMDVPARYLLDLKLAPRILAHEGVRLALTGSSLSPACVTIRQ